MNRDRIQIGPSRYKIKKHHWRSKALAGGRGYHADNHVIGLVKGLPRDQEAEVFLHEILHAVYFTFNMNKMEGLHPKDDPDSTIEEWIVTTFSTALCTVFVQNPWLLDHLKKTLLTR